MSLQVDQLGLAYQCLFSNINFMISKLAYHYQLKQKARQVLELGHPNAIPR